MPLPLKQGDSVYLNAIDSELTELTVCIGWDVDHVHATGVDIDASAFLLTNAGTVRSQEDLVFFHQMRSMDGAVLHTGDHRAGVGGGDGDVEQILIDLQRLSEDIERIAICAVLHGVSGHAQSRAQGPHVYTRCLHSHSGNEIARYVVKHDTVAEVSLVLVDVIRDRRGWKFRAVGKGCAGGLAGLCDHFGVKLGATV